MKNSLYLFIAVLFLSSCVIRQTVTYEKTNASLIQKSIKDLNTVDNLKSKISKTDKIAIIGLEDYDGGDYSLLATLEDEIIKEFVMGGYKVLERDNDMVYRLFAEESPNYKYVNKIKSHNRYYSYDYSKSAIKGSASDGYSNAYLSGSSENFGETVSDAEKKYNQQYQSSLESADKVISYRVIESGIVYDYEEKDAKMGDVEREARTILEVRLTDAKTSEILAAITLDGKANDFVTKQDVNALQSFSYKYYSHTFPKYHGIPAKATVKERKQGNPLPWVAGGLGFIMLISLLAGG